MSYSPAAKASRQTQTRDDLNGGALQIIDATSTVLASVTLDAVCGSVSGAGVLTLSGFPKAAISVAGGVAASARLRTSAGADYKTGLTVGVPGSGAMVIVDNGSNTLLIVVGSSVTFSGSPAPTLAHAA